MTKTGGERSPFTFRAWLTEQQRRNGKVISAMRSISQREFWEEALEEHLAAREKAESGGTRFTYENLHRDADSVSLYADEGLVLQVDEWSKKDNVRKEDALYTAFHRHLELWSQKVVTLGQEE